MEALAHPTTPATEPTRRRCGGRSNGLTVVAIVAGFVIWWPLGIAAVAWAIWRDRISFPPVSRQSTALTSQFSVAKVMRQRPSNSALAAYLESEKERLRAEQAKLQELISAFDAFKEAERRTADQRDFDSFMRQHANDTDDSTPAGQKPAN